MKKFKELLPGIVLLIILIGIACLIFYYIGLGIVTGANWVFLLVQQISTLDTVLIIALISGSITILGLIVNSIISVALKASEHRNKTKAELRVKMEKPYSEFISLIFDMMKSTKQSGQMGEGEVLERMIGFSKEVTLYGSNKVVKRWAKYRTSADKLTPLENLTQMENILFAIREDLGMRKRGMKRGDILSLFINDIQEVLKKPNDK